MASRFEEFIKSYRALTVNAAQFFKHEPTPTADAVSTYNIQMSLRHFPPGCGSGVDRVTHLSTFFDLRQ